jgi:hypothetical protein
MKINSYNNVTRWLASKFSTGYPHQRQLLAEIETGSGSRGNWLGDLLSYAACLKRVLTGNPLSWKTCQLQLYPTQQTVTNL